MPSCSSHPHKDVEGAAVTAFDLPDGGVFEAHRHELPHIEIVLSGAFRDVGPGSTERLEAGEAIVLPPGFTHRNRADRAVRAIAIDVSQAVHPLARDLLRGITRPRRVGREALRDLPERMRDELSAHDRASDLALAAHVLEVIALASRNTQYGEVWPIRAARAFIERNLASPIGLEEVAAAAGYSKGHLARMFRSMVGASVGEYIRRARLRDAAERLLSSDDPVAEVALAAGFFDQAHLARSFKAAHGRTPLEFRRLHRRAPGTAGAPRAPSRSPR